MQMNYKKNKIILFRDLTLHDLRPKEKIRFKKKNLQLFLTSIKPKQN